MTKEVNARLDALIDVLAAVDGCDGPPGGEIWRRRRLASCAIAVASHGPRWRNPASAEEQLERLRREARSFRERLAGLELTAQNALNQEGSELRRRQFEAMHRNDMAALAAAMSEPVPPVSEWLLPSLEAALSRLDEALPRAIERSIAAGAALPETGRPANWRARGVALEVAKYLREVKGAAPALWTGTPPSGPYARALRGCFDVLGIRADIRRAGEWALSKLPPD